MRTLARNGAQPNYLFGLLPKYFKEFDSYKDGNNLGLLERYLNVFCLEIDENVVPYIDDIYYLYDAKKLTELPHTDPSKFLDHLAQLFGNPPDIGTEEQYRSLVRYIVHILTSKGTQKAVNLFLALYGYKVYATTETGLSTRKYDAGLSFDMGATYDVGFNFYSGVDFVITDIPGTSNKFPTDAWLVTLQQAIQKFIAPIFATIGPITYVPYSGILGKATVTARLRSV